LEKGVLTLHSEELKQKILKRRYDVVDPLLCETGRPFSLFFNGKKLEVSLEAKIKMGKLGFFEDFNITNEMISFEKKSILE